MISPRELNIEDFTYLLPEERIARYPLSERDHSKLLVWDETNNPQEAEFHDLANFLPANSLLVLNNTRVIRARLLFRKESGARIELFCLNPVLPVPEMQHAFTQASPVVWECMIGNAKRWKRGGLSMERQWDGETVKLFAERLGEGATGRGGNWATGRLDEGARGRLGEGGIVEDTSMVRFSWEPGSIPFVEIIEHFGHVPLPPYLKREAEPNDDICYQTVYAIHDGSVAAPTAGLHFTKDVFESLAGKGIKTDYLTLHVGAGTFRPVTTRLIGSHLMHPEPFVVSRELLETLLARQYSTCLAVGTTSVRSLESLYWFGVKLLQQKKDPFFLDQWEVYEDLRDDVPFSESLNRILNYMRENDLESIEGITRLIIAPGYRFRVIEGMVTNFHQPGSTLLLLVAALLGENWKKAYQFALEKDFRFLSFGDSCLFWKAAGRDTARLNQDQFITGK